jgi:hypothetical protein
MLFMVRGGSHTQAPLIRMSRLCMPRQVLAHLSRARAEVVCAYGICRTLRLHAPTEKSVQQVLDACQQVQSVAQAVQAAATLTDTL